VATVLCGRRVTGLVLEAGRCAGVETEDGERFMAREAVLSTIHVQHLVEMAPRDAWDRDFLYGVETFDLGVPAFGAYYATSERPLLDAVSSGTAGWPEDQVRAGRDAKEGRPILDGAWLLFATPSLVDDSRAPQGQHTLKILGPQPWDPGGGPERWQELKHEVASANLEHLRRLAPNMTDDKLLASLVKSPVDIEASNEHMIHGTFHGGDRGIAQSGALRPAPGWAQHRRPIPGLYQTGGTTPSGRLDPWRPRAQRGDRDAHRFRTRPQGGDGRCRTRACRQPLTTGPLVSSRWAWTTTTSFAPRRASSAGTSGCPNGVPPPKCTSS
jgi:phytoene dehydrogenase-like protein